MDGFSILDKETYRRKEDLKAAEVSEKEWEKVLHRERNAGNNYTDFYANAYKNMIGAREDARKKFRNYDRGMTNAEHVFLYEEAEGQSIEDKIEKYNKLSDKNDEQLVNYSVQYTNHSASKRSSSAKEAARRYMEYSEYMNGMYEKQAELEEKVRNKTATKEDVKKFFNETIKSFDIRKKAMLSAAEVKSTSSEDEKFRKIKVEREVLEFKRKLASKYLKRYGDRGELSRFFKEQRQKYAGRLSDNAAKYNELYKKVSGEARVDVTLEEVKAVKPELKDVFLSSDKTQNWQNSVFDAGVHFDNGKINSVREALDSGDFGGRYAPQLGKADKVFFIDNKNKKKDEIKLENHEKKGKQYALNSNEHVFKFNTLGTGGTLDGGIDEAKAKKSYGEKVNEQKYGDGVRELEKGNYKHGVKAKTKFTKISIKGTTNSIGVGDYSIDNSTDKIVELAKERMEPIFKKWEADKDAPKENIHFMLEGVSRGGVTSMLGAMAINGWVAKNYPQYAQYVKYDIIQRDPVAGPNVSTEKGKVKIGGAANGQELDENGFIKGTKYKPLSSSTTNSTVFYCFHPDVTAPAFFQPQNIYGANRIILTPAHHTDDGRGNGNFQLDRKRKAGEKARPVRTSYFNNTNGELYTGSGVSDLEDGVYVLDEYDTLTKLQSYEDAERIMNKVRKDVVYSWRKDSILDVVKYWFATHHPQA